MRQKGASDDALLKEYLSEEDLDWLRRQEMEAARRNDIHNANANARS